MTDEKSLAALIEQGGVYHNVSGSNPGEILAELIGLIPGCPSLDRAALLRAVLEREALMTTAIGKGIALPHPRTPMLEEGQSPFVAIAFPQRPLEWNAPDGGTVQTIFLIVSASAKQHLGTLSKINFLCHQELFHSLITARASKETIIAAIREAEAAWQQQS